MKDKGRSGLAYGKRLTDRFPAINPITRESVAQLERTLEEGLLPSFHTWARKNDDTSQDTTEGNSMQRTDNEDERMHIPQDDNYPNIGSSEEWV